MIHAQLDGNNVCIGYGDLKSVESVPNLVYLPDGWDEDLLWRKYVDGLWSTDKFEPAPSPTPTVTMESLQAENEQLNLNNIDIWEALIPLIP